MTTIKKIHSTWLTVVLAFAIVTTGLVGCTGKNDKDITTKYDDEKSEYVITEDNDDNKDMNIESDTTELIGGYGTNGKFLVPIDLPVADSIPISTNAELEAITNNLDGTYHLTANIDLAGAEWVQIGDEEAPFTGTFDGQGYVVSNMRIAGKRWYSGLFGFAKGATIKNIGLEGTLISTVPSSKSYQGAYVGAVCGEANDSTILNCYNIGDVSTEFYNSTSTKGGVSGSGGIWILPQTP